MINRIIRSFTLPALLLLGISLGTAAQVPDQSPDGQTGTLKKMIVTGGNVTLDLNLNQLQGISAESKMGTFHFGIDSSSFFSVLVFDDLLRGPQPGLMGLLWGSSAVLPEPLNTSASQLALEKTPFGSGFDLVVRDARTGFVFFNVVGNQYHYDSATHSLQVVDGRLLISAELASRLGRPEEAGNSAGAISISASLTPIEMTTVVNGVPQASQLPSRREGGQDDPNGGAPGPDVIVGDLMSMEQFGSSGTQVGLGIGTTSCNNGTVDLNWFALPNIDHPVIPQNLYRMSGSASNNERFEQIGQSWLKHAFTALTENACNFGCNGVGGSHLGVGCSDPYGAGLNASQGGLGSRAWVNPFTGAFPTNASSHGHSHTGTAHRVLVEASDLNTTLNPGATYYAEAQYVTPHEFAWCQTHPGQCNMYNNASYRRFNVTGTTSFNFSPVGGTVRMAPAIAAWTGATINTIEPAPGVDGRAFLAYRVTGPVGGIWHYEYAILNQNLDRSIQSFTLPLGCGITLSNVGFHAPPNHPGISNDGTVANAGYSNTAWATTQNLNLVSWNSQTFAQDQNANAIRWGTLYNFRFDSNRPPQSEYAIIGFFKTGAPIAVPVQGPAPAACNASPPGRR